MSNIYVGDIGTRLTLNAGSDISSASVLRIKYKKPDGTEGYWVATLSGTNYAYYDFQSGDIDQAGTWEFQLYIVSTSWSGHGESAELRVYEVYD